MVYIGVDLHRKVSQVAAVQTNGQVLWNRRIRSRPEEFAEIVGDLPASPAGQLPQPLPPAEALRLAVGVSRDPSTDSAPWLN